MVRPLLPALTVGWLCYLAVAVLSVAPSFRVYDAGWLPYTELIKRAAYALGPDALLAAGKNAPATPLAMLLYAILMLGAFVSWVWAIRLARRIELTSVTPLLALTALLALPMVVLPGLLSDDVYLYNLYGRTITTYGLNPMEFAPSSFPDDPHLPWVHWKDLPSSYGPVWLMLSAVLSRLGADSLSSMVVAYRVAGAALHLLTVAVIWYALRARRPQASTAHTIFYAWNPLVLLEVVGNAHNDVLVALFAVLLVSAAMQRLWLGAVFFGACAAMVKPYALVLLVPVARRIVEQARGGALLRSSAAAAGVALGTMTLLSAPLWAGSALLQNVLHNPATQMYTNTVWELISEVGPAWLGMRTVAIQHPYLDLLRLACFAAGVWWVVARARAGGSVADMAFGVWLVFCLTACWVWPWYFVPALALAPLAGALRLPAATALTLGGLVFWTAWPERKVWPLETLYFWRSLVLFGPVLLTLAWRPARRLVLDRLRSKRAAGHGDTDGPDAELQTAA